MTIKVWAWGTHYNCHSWRGASNTLTKITKVDANNIKVEGYIAGVRFEKKVSIYNADEGSYEKLFDLGVGEEITFAH